MSDILKQHKERILDEWVEPDDIWTMQAGAWAGACAVYVGFTKAGARGKIGGIVLSTERSWRKSTGRGRGKDGVDINVGRRERGFAGFCEGRSRERMDCWVLGEGRKGGEGVVGVCRFEGVVRESVAAILGTDARIVRDWEEREGRGRGGVPGERVDKGRYGDKAAGRV